MRDVEFELNDKGFPQPKLADKDLLFCTDVCPASGKLWETCDGKVWGKYRKVYLGWSTDENIRQLSSSGGVLTTVAIYLLEQGIVDGIIQTRQDATLSYATETVISRTREDVLKCMGSRYSISSPLESVKQIVETGKKYCFIGKPCDVYALKAYMRHDEKLAEMIPITMSFFCAGVPSRNAQRKLLAKLGSSEDQCADLRYRGDGWPGFTTATNKNGERHQITYNESWGKILGRDVRKSCRLCLDGIGAFADIACGDAWYLREGKPDFSEGDGRNVIFARTDNGEKILKAALDSDALRLEDYNNRIDAELKLIQAYQYNRRTTMKFMLFAMRICRKSRPNYSSIVLKNLSKYATTKDKIRKFIGTLKRIYLGKI